MKRSWISFILFLIGLILFFIFPFTNNLVLVINILIFIVAIIFAGISIQIMEGKSIWIIGLLVLNILSIFYLLLNVILFSGPSII